MSDLFDAPIVLVERDVHFVYDCCGIPEKMRVVTRGPDGEWLCAYEAGMRRDALFPRSEAAILATAYRH